MSIVRNLAQKLSDFVVKHASPGSKEWAEAMASEAGAIENDWHALGWAAGGLRVLFYPQPKPLGKPNENGIQRSRFQPGIEAHLIAVSPLLRRA